MSSSTHSSPQSAGGSRAPLSTTSFGSGGVEAFVSFANMENSSPSVSHINLPPPGLIHKESWSPASSESGETEGEEGSFHEDHRHHIHRDHGMDVKVLSKEVVGDGASFFDVAPLQQELCALEEPKPEVQQSRSSPIALALAPSSVSMAETEVFQGERTTTVQTSSSPFCGVESSLSQSSSPLSRPAEDVMTNYEMLGLPPSAVYARNDALLANMFETGSHPSMNAASAGARVNTGFRQPSHFPVADQVSPRFTQQGQFQPQSQQQQQMMMGMGRIFNDRSLPGAVDSSAYRMTQSSSQPAQIRGAQRPMTTSFPSTHSMPSVNRGSSMSSHGYTHPMSSRFPGDASYNSSAGFSQNISSFAGQGRNGNNGPYAPIPPSQAYGGGAGHFLPSPPASLPYNAHYGGSVLGAPPQSNGRIYQVQFKGTIRFYILGCQASPTTAVGEFVVVEADRGEDVGIVTEILPMKTFIERRYMMKTAVDDEDSTIGRIVRSATSTERQQLVEKYHDEQNVMQFCRELAHHTYRLPLIIQDAEYQFDRHKLTIYYHAESRVDFRELVRDLFSAFKARIWMKKINPHTPYRLDANAQMALATGVHLALDNNRRSDYPDATTIPQYTKFSPRG
eukprot:gene7436-8223_t